MPYYSRYRRRTGFARYRRRYSGYRRRYYRRRTSTGGSLSSRSRLRIRVPAQRVVTLTIPSESTDSDVATANPFFEQLNDRPQCVCSAVGMPLYQAYTGLFDQVKCDGVVTKVAVVSPIGSGAALQALQLLIAYDRQGTINETINSPASVTVSSLYNMSSVQIRSAINNSVAKTARSCWASDIQERTVFHDCTIAVTQDKKVIYDQDYNSDRQVAAYFVPLTYIGIRNAAAAATSSTSVQILIEQVYYFTFRNPKFGAAPATGGGTRALVAAEDDPLATESLDDAPQALVDMAVRAADATGTLVRTHGRSGLTPQAKKTRLLDEADRLDADARDRWARIEELDANLQSRYGHPTTATSYPQSERERLDKMAKAASQRSATAASLREQAATLDEEDALSYTDTLPLDE